MFLVCSAKKSFPFKNYIELILFVLHYSSWCEKISKYFIIHQNVKDGNVKDGKY